MAKLRGKSDFAESALAESTLVEWYSARFGSRWQTLYAALKTPPQHVEYSCDLKKTYLLDEASVLAAQSLRLPDEGIILDACAAPGGKSLVIASTMGEKVKLISNEFSSDRRRRLSLVLDECLDEERRRRVAVSGFDAAALGGNKAEWSRFDAIILDAPCSSERHVIQSEKALAEWTPARPKFLARRQWALLSSAFLLLKPGASLVYSTCALCEEENDGVIKRLFEKYGSEAQIDPPDFDAGEKTVYGKIILPDADGGLGPMYVARIRKKVL